MTNIVSHLCPVKAQRRFLPSRRMEWSGRWRLWSFACRRGAPLRGDSGRAVREGRRVFRLRVRKASAQRWPPPQMLREGPDGDVTGGLGEEPGMHVGGWKISKACIKKDCVPRPDFAGRPPMGRQPSEAATVRLRILSVGGGPGLPRLGLWAWKPGEKRVAAGAATLQGTIAADPDGIRVPWRRSLRRRR